MAEHLGVHSMGLLAEYRDVRDQTEQLWSYVEAIVMRLVHLHAPRTVAELPLDDTDYNTLCAWASNLTPRAVNVWLNSFGPSRQVQGVTLIPVQAAGLMLLLVISETARREAREGSLWPSIIKLFSDPVRRALFAQGQPTRLLKDALEAAARELRFRHVFDTEGTQEYYQTVFLQVGFTEKGLVRLPYWLIGQGQPEAVRRLLQPTTGSQSFQRLWQVLHNYRLNNITDSQARNALSQSPWVLPAWTEYILQKAKERLPQSVADMGATDEDPEPIAFLDNPALRWSPGSEPTIVYRLSNLAAQGLESPRYTLTNNGNPVTRLVKSSDGSYAALSHEVEFSLDVPQRIAALVSIMGQVEHSAMLELWNPTDLLTLFEMPQGNKLSSRDSPMDQHRAYALLTPAEFNVTGISNPTWQLVGRQSMRLLWIPPGWPSTFKLQLGNEVLWRPNANGEALTVKANPAWAAGIGVRFNSGTAALSSHITPRIVGVPRDTEVTFLRIAGKPLDFSIHDGGAICTGLEVTPELVAGKVEFVIGLKRGSDTAVIHREARLAVHGAVRLGESGWETVDSEEPLTATEAQTCRYKIFTGYVGTQNQDEFDAVLVEGSTFLKRLSTKAATLGRLGGYGAPLEVSPRPYNRAPDDTLFVLSAETRDPGAILGATWKDDNQLSIRLSQPLEPDGSFGVVCWAPGIQPYILDSSHILRRSDDVWWVTTGVSMPRQVAISLTYDGARVGSVWPERFLQGLGGVGAKDALQTAALIRWFHTPILGVDFNESCRLFALTYPAEALAAWMLGLGLPGGLEFEPDGEEWLAAVRDVLWDWMPSRSQVGNLMEFLGGTVGSDASEPFLQILTHQMQRLNPILMGRILLKAVSEWQDISPAELRSTTRAFASLPQDASDAALNAAVTTKLERALEGTNIDSAFIEHSVARKCIELLGTGQLEALAKLNIAMAFGRAPIREYAAFRILEFVSQMHGRGSVL